MNWKFWGKSSKVEDSSSSSKHEKLPKPKDIPEHVGRYLIVELGKDPDWVWKLKGVVRPRQNEKNTFDVRVFSQNTALQVKANIKNYTSLDEHPELILYEGWFNKATLKVHIEENKTPSQAA